MVKSTPMLPNIDLSVRGNRGPDISDSRHTGTSGPPALMLSPWISLRSKVSQYDPAALGSDKSILQPPSA